MECWFQELRVKPVPTVLASFSGGSKGCMYKVIQVHALSLNFFYDLILTAICK